MSHLSGIFYFDQRPVSRTDQAECRSAIGATSVWEHSRRGLLMAQQSASSRLALDSRTGDAAMLEGCLHNRQDLARESGVTLAECGDSQLALAIYQRHGIAGLRKLIGDWSLAVWDAAASNLTLASDYAGIRPLYYCRKNHFAAWSTSLDGLVRWMGSEDQDEDYVAAFLSRGSADHYTPYRGIHAVPSGCAIELSKIGAAQTKFWTPPVSDVTRYTHPGEYRERLWDLFEEAVHVRMQTPRPVSVELSGGLDSSSVLCMAHRQVSRGATPGQGIVSFHYRDQASGDERYARAVEEHCGLSSLDLALEDFPLLAPGLAGNSMPALWEPRFLETSRLMAISGSPVLLTGQFGDLVMGNWMDDSDQVADHLVRGSIGGAVREAFQWSRFLRTPVYPILWRAARSSLGAGVFSGFGDMSQDAARKEHGDSLTGKLTRRIRERGAAHEYAWLRSAPPSRRKRLAALNEVLTGRLLQCPEALQPFHWTHPFAHRPLVEFMMTIPSEELCRPGVSRRLMRSTFAQLLPEAIWKRSSKGSYQSFFLRSLRPLASALLRSREELQVAQRGFVDKKSLEIRLQRLGQGLECNEPQLRFVLALEYWLRSRDRNGTASVSQRICQFEFQK
jgi:asparagine synthase (glutamine-hydrolysing)